MDGCAYRYVAVTRELASVDADVACLSSLPRPSLPVTVLAPTRASLSAAIASTPQLPPTAAAAQRASGGATDPDSLAARWQARLLQLYKLDAATRLVATREAAKGETRTHSQQAVDEIARAVAQAVKERQA